MHESGSALNLHWSQITYVSSSHIAGRSSNKGTKY